MHLAVCHDSVSLHDACMNMSALHVDAVVVSASSDMSTDLNSNSVLGVITAKDVAEVIATSCSIENLSVGHVLSLQNERSFAIPSDGGIKFCLGCLAIHGRQKKPYLLVQQGSNVHALIDALDLSHD